MTSEQSAVQQFYSGRTVLITGGSGFLGKVLIEKLLRACPQLHQIVLLMRNKRGTESQQRLENLFDDDFLKCLSNENRRKVITITGDCQLQDLGLTNIDRQRLVENVNIVFHVAATIKFNEGLALAVATNVSGTKAMLDLAREIVSLKAFVHVSTAYSNCDKDHIDEKFYPPKYDPIKLMRLSEAVDEPYLSQLTPLLLQDVPNTYVFTKMAAEELVRTHSKGLPVSVFRPSIVVSSRIEPVPGWIDNFQGPAGLMAAVITGTMRTLNCDGNKVADLVPVDMTVNALIVTAWKTHNRTIEVADPRIYNFVSSVERPLQWNKFVAYCKRYHVPSVHAMWVLKLWMTRYKVLHRVLHVFLHVLPAYMVDIVARLFGCRTNLMKTTNRVQKMTNLLVYFMTREWTFSNFNTQQLWLSLSPQDRQLFPFSFAEFDWDSYSKSYMLGIRQYLLKDDLTTLPRAESKHKWLYRMNRALQAVLLFGALKVVWNLVNHVPSSYLFSSFDLFTPLTSKEQLHV